MTSGYLAISKLLYNYLKNSTYVVIYYNNSKTQRSCIIACIVLKAIYNNYTFLMLYKKNKKLGYILL